jgi:uncharacterized protein YegL
MSGLESDTIGGFNSMLEKQKKEDGEANVTTVLFDDQYELLHDRVSIDKVSPITGDDYFVRGTTALLDAIGKTIKNITAARKSVAKEERAAKVLFVITTDGLENASREYKIADVKAMIEKKKAKKTWEFIFLGANIDAISEAAKIGISADRAANFHADSVGTGVGFYCMSRAVSSYRGSDADSESGISDDWKDETERDYTGRKLGAR